MSDSIRVKDLDQVEAWTGGPILGPGTHHVRIDSVAVGKSSNGYPQLEIEFLSEAGAGQVRDWLVVIPSTYGKVKSLLEACGIQSQGGEWDLPLDRLKGSKLLIDVAEEPDFNDPTKTRTKVVAYKPVGAANNDLPVDTGATADGDDLPF